MNNAAKLLDKFDSFNKIAMSREQKPFCSFIWTIQSHKVHEDCKSLSTMKVDTLTAYGGYNQPVCNNPDAANLFAQDGRKILTCIGCSGYEKDKH